MPMNGNEKVSAVLVFTDCSICSVPIPIPAEPVSHPGTVISNAGTSMEVSCDGGTARACRLRMSRPLAVPVLR